MNLNDTDRYYQYNQNFARTQGEPKDYQTKLKPAQEALYRKWLDSTAKDTGTDLNPDDPGYDMRGFWADKVVPGNFKRMSPGQHFPDTYKTPYHPTFSRESRYATHDAPFWNDKDELVDSTTGLPTANFHEEIQRELEGKKDE